MFEKEAIEYATVGWDKSQDPRSVFTRRIDETKFNDWRNAAEFGYNKAKKEMQEIGLALQSDMDKTIEQNIALKKELEKANEWHEIESKVSPKREIRKEMLKNKGYFTVNTLIEKLKELQAEGYGDKMVVGMDGHFQFCDYDHSDAEILIC